MQFYFVIKTLINFNIVIYSFIMLKKERNFINYDLENNKNIADDI